MAINSQLSTIETKQQAKQTSRRETESYIWRSFGWLSVGRGEGEIGRKEIEIEIGRYRKDGMLRIVYEMEQPKNLYA